MDAAKLGPIGVDEGEQNDAEQVHGETLGRKVLQSRWGVEGRSKGRVRDGARWLRPASHVTLARVAIQLALFQVGFLFATRLSEVFRHDLRR